MTLHPFRAASAAVLTSAWLFTFACASAPPTRTFATPEEAVGALTAAVKAGNLDEVVAIFGPSGQALIDSSDAATAKRNRDIFTTAVAERWRLEAHGQAGRLLVVGNEEWPFPVPLVQDGSRWRFDTDAGAEEILARRIGRNELAAIRICRAYVTAQHLYAASAHDGEPAGRYAVVLRSDAGRHNGLYWAAAHGEKRSPLGELVAQAAEEGRSVGQGDASTPFHGYFFKIVPSQGGAALVAWPAQYDASGIMTFLVNQDGDVREKDLGAQTDGAARGMSTYKPDTSWSAVPPPS